MYKNGYDIINSEVIQNSALMPDLSDVPYELSMNYVKPPALLYDNMLTVSLEPVTNLFELNSIFAYNATSDKYTAAADIRKINTHKIPIPINSINGNWINGISPRFAQKWQVQHEKD